MTGRLISALGGPWAVLLGLPVIALLYLMHLRGPDLPHNLAELFSVVVAFGVFMLTWNARRFLDNHFFLFLGIAYLFVGIIDSLHALAFDGWIGGRKAQLGEQLWYAARYLQGVSLVIAPWLTVRKIRPGVTLASFFIATAFLMMTISGGTFQGWYDRETHAWFMNVSDFCLFGLGVAAFAMLRRAREHFDGQVFLRLALSIVFVVVSEVSEGLGRRGFESLYLFGDLFQTLSYYLVYKAVIETGLLRPYDLLFRNLKRSEEVARAARTGLEARADEWTAELRGVNELLSRELVERKIAEQEREMMIELLRMINRAKSIRELATGLMTLLRERTGCESVGVRYRAGSEYPFIETNRFPDEYAHAGSFVCPAGGEKEAAAADRVIPTRECLCGAIVPGEADESFPVFTGERTFWTNSISALLAERGGVRRLVVRDQCKREEFESLALIPLRSGETTLGFLQFGDRRKAFFTHELIAKLERVADHVAVALAQHLAKEALRESEDRFRSLVENAPVGILIVREGRILFRNPGLARLFGEIPDGARFRDLGSVHPEDRERFERLCEAIEQANPGWKATELRFTMDEGDPGRHAMRWVYCQGGQIEFRGRTAALVVLDDMTRMKDLEQIVSAREKLSIIGQMAAGIAHEIRNPLSGININVSTLEHVVRNLEGVSPEERGKLGEIVSQAKAASDKIATVIRRVMDFSKPVPPKLDRVDVNQVIREALEFSSATLRKSGIEVEISLLPGLPKCTADPRLLEQVLLNLITNAVQALENVEGRKRLGVASVLEAGAVLLRVFDNGPGVPVHLREKIFDPFYTTRKTGHGIGLSFSHRIIENHGGTLSASVNDWGGAEFRITLPLETEGSGA
ncbi:MASE3 domain-containing protein [Candidatus Deferrimicrobium sp.]|uniref:MASE3 domain-containing protein n=1 Tax=Candidatus Deferrimicrobium sp. TaxID=3060586 RepID=UPI003C531661